MSIQLYDTYQVCSALGCALMYGDFSGLENDEQEAVEEFFIRLPESHWFDLSGDETDFSWCEVLHVQADCIELRVYVKEEAA